MSGIESETIDGVVLIKLSGEVDLSWSQQVRKAVLAVDEACANIIRHAYGGETRGGIGLRVSRVDDVLSFELTDDAPCVDPGRMRPKPLGECRAGGLGIALIDTVMDTWHVEPASSKSGNRLVLRKRIEDKGYT